MASLAKCLDSAGIEQAEGKIMKSRSRELIKSGYTEEEANRKVVLDAITDLNTEWDSTVEAVEKKLGRKFKEKSAGRKEVPTKTWRPRPPIKTGQAKTFRSYVKALGGINQNDEGYRGEIADISAGARWQPGVKSSKGLMMDELLAQIEESGEWKGVISTAEDVLDALATNPTKPTSIEEKLDEDIKKHYEELEEYEEHLKSQYGENYEQSEEFRRDEEAAQTDLKEEVEREVAIEIERSENLTDEEIAELEALSPEEYEDLTSFDPANFVEERQLGLFGTQTKPEFELTPEEGTKHEKAAKLEKEGIVKRPEKTKKPAVFPKEGITPPTSGTQKQLFPGKGETYDLFDQAEATKDIEFKPLPKAKAETLLPATRTRMATTGKLRASGFMVGNVDDAASLLAPIRKARQENAYTITVDKDGNALEIHRLAKGGVAQSIIPTVIGAGRVLNIKGAHTVYFAHNHPSGEVIPSQEDLKAARGLSNILKLKGIKLKSLVIGGTSYMEFTETGSNLDEKRIRPTVKKQVMPVKEGELIVKPKGPALKSSTDARVAAKTYGDKEGFIFLDRKNNVLGFLPFTSGLPQKETTTSVIQAAERLNASAVVFNSPKDLSQGKLKYLKDVFPALSELALTDILTPSRSYADEGLLGGFKPPSTEERAFDVAASDQTLFSAQKTPIPSAKPMAEGADRFYSQVIKTVQDKMPAKMQASAVMNWLRKQPGIKAAELDWMDVEGMLEGKKVVTKDELVKLLKENQVVVEEVEKGEAKEIKIVSIESLGGGYPTVYEIEFEDGSTTEIDMSGEYGDDKNAVPMDKVAQLAQESRKEDALEFEGRLDLDPTKFSQWQLEGEKENYRELLFKLPVKKIESGPVQWKERVPGEHKAVVGNRVFGIVTEDNRFYVYEEGGVLGKPVQTVEAGKQVVADAVKNPQEAGFISSHWDEPNVFAHVRVNERTDADGNKVLFVEEIQSDHSLEHRKQLTNIEKSVTNNFKAIVKNMTKLGVLKEVC